MEIKNIIAFAILMENDQGILNKSRDYVEEKFKRLILQPLENPEMILDGPNKAKLEAWFEKWSKLQ